MFGPGPFTKSQHKMALIDINLLGTKVYVYNPSRGAEYSGWQDFDYVTTSLKGAYKVNSR